MTRRLARANIENNPDLLDEVASLVRSVKGAWDEMPESANQASAIAE